MIQKDKKSDIYSDLSNDLFSQVDIDLINEKLDDNLPVLYANEAYAKIDDKLLDLNEKLTSSFNQAQKKLFREYIDTSIEANFYQNCLAYYLGIKMGSNISELK